MAKNDSTVCYAVGQQVFDVVDPEVCQLICQMILSRLHGDSMNQDSLKLFETLISDEGQLFLFKVEGGKIVCLGQAIRLDVEGGVTAIISNVITHPAFDRPVHRRDVYRELCKTVDEKWQPAAKIDSTGLTDQLLADLEVS